MTPHQLASIVAYCEDLWPGTRNYRSVATIAADFANIPADAAQAAVNALMTERPSRAPYLAEILTRAREIAADRRDTDPLDTNCDLRGRHGTLAILSDILAEVENDIARRTKIAPGFRLAECLDCGAELIRRADLLETAAERDDRIRRGQPPPDPRRPSTDGDRSDRIAP